MNTPSGGAQVMDTAKDTSAATMDELLDRWLAEHVITDAQAQYMHADVEQTKKNAQEHRRHVASIAIEVLGYLGSVIILVAVGLLVGQFWDRIPTAVIAAVALMVTAALVVAGMFLPVARSDVAARLRSVLYVVACVTFAGAAAVIADEYLANVEVVLISFASATVLAAALWFVVRAPLQHVAFYVAALMTTGLTVEWLMPAPPAMWVEVRPAVLAMPALAVWAFGVTWLLLSWAGVIRPAELGKVLGAVAMLSGILSAGPENWTIFLGLATVAALAALAFYLRDLGVLIVAAVGTLQILPMAVVQLFPGAVAAAGALLVVGALLVIGAIYLARNRARFALHRSEREVPTLAVPLAVGAAVAVWALTIAVIVFVALAT